MIFYDLSKGYGCSPSDPPLDRNIFNGETGCGRPTAARLDLVKNQPSRTATADLIMEHERLIP